MNILFLCSYNRCRSPLAEAIANEYIKLNNIKDINIYSAGIYEYLNEGETPCQEAINIASDYGLDINQLKSKKYNELDLKDIDIIFVMDKSNYSNFNNQTQNKFLQKTIKLGFLKSNEDIIDPYNSPEEIESVFEIIMENIEYFFEEVLNSLKEYDLLEIIIEKHQDIELFINDFDLSGKIFDKYIKNNNKYIQYAYINNKYIKKEEIIYLYKYSEYKEIKNKIKEKFNQFLS